VARDVELGRGRPSAECEAVRLGARVEELDLESALVDRRPLADQLEAVLVDDRPMAVGPDVGPGGVGRDRAVEKDAEPNRPVAGRGPSRG
jgi:hypothetical protein